MTHSYGDNTPDGPSRFTRRAALMGGLAALGAAAFGAARWFNIGATVGQGDLTAPQAQAAAAAGEILLIDIRRPEEWAQTGVPDGATPLDMRSALFEDRLLALTDGRRDVPVALICARGVRSAALSARLTKAGFTRVINVPEGMLGSGAGPGWIAQGLPVRQPE